MTSLPSNPMTHPISKEMNLLQRFLVSLACIPLLSFTFLIVVAVYVYESSGLSDTLIKIIFLSFFAYLSYLLPRDLFYKFSGITPALAQDNSTTPKPNPIHKMANGDYGLLHTYFILLIPVDITYTLVTSFIPGFIYLFVFYLSYMFIASIGVWNAANRHPDKTMAFFAKVFVVSRTVTYFYPLLTT